MAQRVSEDQTRKLIVTELRDLATLPNGSLLYEARVTDEHGEVVDLPFRTFQELELGRAQDFVVRPYDSEGYGRTYTLIPKERESRTKQLTKQLQALEERFNDLENTIDQRILDTVDDEMKKRGLTRAF